MSSTTKDARWQLAYDRLDTVGLSWGQLTTVGQTAALEEAQKALDRLPARSVEILAERWNAPPFDPVRVALLDILGRGLDDGLTVDAILAGFDVRSKEGERAL
jgi:hypothetical protein